MEAEDSTGDLRPSQTQRPCFLQSSVWAKREQSTGRPRGRDSSLGKRRVPCRAVHRGKMFFANCVHTSLK
jgi:hypothetical protein